MAGKRHIDRETLKLIKGHLGYIKRRFRPEKVILFGSRARGDHLKTSDIDLLIVSKEFEDVNFHDRMVMAYGSWDREIDLEPLCYTPSEFEEKKKQIGLVRQAVKEGVEV